ncbi:hypothetical protein, partial [Thiolapillus sp.]
AAAAAAGGLAVHSVLLWFPDWNLCFLLLLRVASMMERYNIVCFTQNADLWSWTVNVSAVKVLKATDCVSLGLGEK